MTRQTRESVLYCNMKMKLTKQDAENLINALEEWNDVVGPKELEDNEVGLNAERYDELKNKLEAIND